MKATHAFRNIHQLKSMEILPPSWFQLSPWSRFKHDTRICLIFLTSRDQNRNPFFKLVPPPRHQSPSTKCNGKQSKTPSLAFNVQCPIHPKQILKSIFLNCFGSETVSIGFRKRCLNFVDRIVRTKFRPTGGHESRHGPVQILLL